MTKNEKANLIKEIDSLHSELERWLTAWFRPTANEIKESLNEKFEKFEKQLKRN